MTTKTVVSQCACKQEIKYGEGHNVDRCASLLQAVFGRLAAENERLTTDLNWIHGAASWLKNNKENPRAWQCIQDIIDTSSTAQKGK